MKVIMLHRESDSIGSTISLFADTPEGLAKARHDANDAMRYGDWVESHGHGLLGLWSDDDSWLTLKREEVRG